MAEVGGVGPFLEIGGRVYANDELLGIGDDHGPFLSWGIPNYLICQEILLCAYIEGVSTLGSLNWVELIEITGFLAYLVNVYPPSRE